MSNPIVALSTPTGESAIAVVRMSGGGCAEIAAKALGLKKTPEPRRAVYAKYARLDGTELDDVVAVFFKAPASYTGEDCVEISTHGNPFIVREVVADLIARGAAAAQAGEFTRRAFENGKLDLSQAEAVALTIGARSERALKAAKKQLSGELGRRVADMSERILNCLALVEAYIDFPEDDLPEEDKQTLARTLGKCAEDMAKLIDTAKYSRLVYGGIDAVIAGAPNAGKSSLLNLLLGSDRAIVSDIAGTTRDFISESVSVRGNTVRFTDTAGLRDSSDKLEALGIERARKKISDCDICLFVVDASDPDSAPKPDSPDIAGLTRQNAIMVFNKCDIAQGNLGALRGRYAGFECAEISCAENSGIEGLKDKIGALIDKYHITASADDILVSARHAQSLQAAMDSTVAAARKTAENAPSELVASDLREALDSLGDIVGKTDNEALLDRIFSKFCIGK